MERLVVIQLVAKGTCADTVNIITCLHYCFAIGGSISTSVFHLLVSTRCIRLFTVNFLYLLCCICFYENTVSVCV